MKKLVIAPYDLVKGCLPNNDILNNPLNLREIRRERESELNRILNIRQREEGHDFYKNNHKNYQLIDHQERITVLRM